MIGALFRRRPIQATHMIESITPIGYGLSLLMQLRFLQTNQTLT